MGNAFGFFDENAADLMVKAHKAESDHAYQDAKRLYLEAMDYMEPESEELAACQDRLGCLLVRSGELVEALRSFKRALSIKKAISPESSSTAKTLSNIAAVYCGKGEHEKAVSILEECLKIREMRDPDSLKLSKTLSNLAVVLQHLDRYDEAIKLHERVFQIKEIQAPGTVSMATTCVNLANLCIRTDQSRCVFHLKRAKLIAESTSPVPCGVLSDVFTVTGHMLRHAHFFREAIDMYEKAILFERYAMPQSPKIATLLEEIESTRMDAEGSDNSTPLSDKMTESAEHLRHLAVPPSLLTPPSISTTTTTNSVESPHTPQAESDPSHSPDNTMGTDMEYTPSSFDAVRDALPYPSSFDAKNSFHSADSASNPFMLESLSRVPERQSYENPMSPYKRSALACNQTPETSDNVGPDPPAAENEETAKESKDRPRSLSTIRRSGAQPDEYENRMLDYLVSVADARRAGCDGESVLSSLHDSVLPKATTRSTTKEAFIAEKKKKTAKKKKTVPKKKEKEDESERKDTQVRKEVKEEEDDGIRLIQSLNITGGVEERHPTSDDSSQPPMVDCLHTSPEDDQTPRPSDAYDGSPRERTPPVASRCSGQVANLKTRRPGNLMHRFRTMLRTPPRTRSSESKIPVAPSKPKGNARG